MTWTPNSSSQVGTSWFVVFSILHFLIAFGGIVLNSMIVNFILRNLSGKNINTYFYLNIAVTMLLMSAANIPLTAVSNAIKMWPFGKIGCDYFAFSGGVFGLVIIVTLMCMSVQRYFSISSSVYTLSASKKSNILFCIGTIWFYCMVIMLFQSYSQHGFVLEGLGTSCTFDYMSRDRTSRTLMISMIVLGFAMPLGTIVVANSMLFVAVRRSQREIQRMLTSAAPLVTQQASQTTRFVGVQLDLRSVGGGGGGGNSRTSHGGDSVSWFSYGETNRSTTDRSVRSVQLASVSLGSRRAAVQNGAVQLKAIRTTRSGRLRTLTLGDMYASSSGAVTRLHLKQRDNFLHRESRVAKSIAVTVGLFCFAWSPYLVIVLIGQFSAHTHILVTPYTTALPGLFAKSSVVLVALEYIYSNSKLKRFYRLRA